MAREDLNSCRPQLTVILGEFMALQDVFEIPNWEGKYICVARSRSKFDGRVAVVDVRDNLIAATMPGFIPSPLRDVDRVRQKLRADSSSGCEDICHFGRHLVWPPGNSAARGRRSRRCPAAYPKLDMAALGLLSRVPGRDGIC